MNTPKIRKIKHKDRKHFMERHHGHYAYGVDEKISGNEKFAPAYGTRTGYTSDRGFRSKAEKLNSAMRNDKE